MRFVLQIIFLFFAFLIVIENGMRALLANLKKFTQKNGSRLQRKTRSVAQNTTHLITPVARQLNAGKKKCIIFINHAASLLRRHATRKRRRKKNSHTLPMLGKLKYFTLGALFSLLFVFLPLVFLVFLQDLPSPKELSFREIPQTTKIFDRQGVLLAEIYTNQNRTLIPLSDVPRTLQEATLAIEDKNFYTHPGFDIPAIIRAFKKDLSGESTQGGSTITQQLIKSSILSPEQSISRKIKEIVLAFWAERIYTKRQILEMYFNQVPYGGTAWGVEAASETYFNKHAKELDLAQSAFLAGLTAAPTIYSPYGQNPTAWKKRQKEVLQRMLSLRYITKKEKEQALSETLQFPQQQTAIHAPHFVNYIRDLLVAKYGLPTVEKGGLQVITSLDLPTQEMAEKAVKEEVDNDASLNISNGAAVITDPQNGDILAMVGSRDFYDPNGGNYNLATALRQPGSSIKVITYSAGFEHGLTPATMIDDSPINFPDGVNTYAPVNYDGKFHGKLPVRLTLANSLNIPAVKVLNQIGISTMVEKAKQMGITTWGDPSQYGLSLTLGAGEVTMLDMATVYGTLANGGYRVILNPILKITDAKGTVLEQKTQTSGVQALKNGVAFLISNILADNQARTMEFGPNSPLVIPGHTVAVKTGTTDSKRDNWTDGYTNNYAVIVWVGNNDNSPMSPTLASGITGAAPIWHRIMTTLLRDHPEIAFSPPPEVIQKPCLGRIEYFLRGTENSINCGPPIVPTGVYSAR